MDHSPPNCFSCKRPMRHDGDSQIGQHLVRHYSCEHCIRAALDHIGVKPGELPKLFSRPEID